MGINFRTLLPFLLFHFFKGSSAQIVHDVVTYTTKSEEKLECSFSSSIKQWTDQRDDGKAINIFLYNVAMGLPQKQTNDRKYDNFNYSIEGTNGFNLVITNVDKDDGGRYQCNPITSAALLTFDVTVEVLPESINIHCTGLNACMPSAEIKCVCTATGFISSPLELEWEGVGTPITSNTSRVVNHTPGSFNISSEITFPPPDGTSSISCSLTGYRSQIPESLRSSTYTFSQPECNLVHECPSDGTNASLICSCSKGSPTVNAYSFYDSQKAPIGTQRSSSNNVQVETHNREIFYCSGCNGLLQSKIVGDEFNCKQVPPKQLYLSVAGSVIDQEISIMKDEEVNITCHAIGALPAANLSWRVNNNLVNFPSTYSSLKNKEGTFDAVSTILFRPKPEHKEVECVFNGSGKEQVVHGTLLLKDKPIFQNIPLLWAIASSGVASLLMILNCICCLRRKFKASKSTNSLTDSDESLDYFAPEILPTSSDNACKEWEYGNERNWLGPSKLQLHRAVTTTEECEYENYNTDIEELNLPEISINTDQPLYGNCDAEPQKCKFPRISVLPEPHEDNEYKIDVTQC